MPHAEMQTAVVFFAFLLLLLLPIIRAQEPMCERKRVNYFQMVKVCTNITDRFNSSIVFDSSLMCVHCNIPTLDENTLANYTQEMFNLSDANVRTVTPRAFDNVGADLHRLILADNHIDHLPQGIFRKFATLDEITLRGNQITDVAGLFADMGATGIDLSENRLQSIGGAFRNVSVVKLNLSHNLIETIDVNDFNTTRFWEGRERKSWYQELAMNHNRLQLLRPGTFHMAAETKLSGAVHLQNNLLEVIENDTFLELNQLGYLDLSNNRIVTLYANSFKGLTHVQTLRLSYNRIATIPFGMFRDMQMVRKLDLDNNRLTELRDNLFSGLMTLINLNVSQNQIKTIAEASLFPLGRLTTLDVSANQLHQLNLELIWQHHGNLRSLALSDNLWTCRDLVNMYKLLNHKSGVLERPAKHFDVPNLHGIACSRATLDNYENIDFNQFLETIADDRAFEDIYDSRLNGNERPSQEDILETVRNIRGISHMLIIVTITCVLIFARLFFLCVQRVLQAKNMIAGNKFSFFYTPRQDNVQLL